MNTVNRHLADKTFNRIDHALGRPLDPTGETYRNHYAVDAGNPCADEMRASPHWTERQRAGDRIWFSVTKEGRSALRDHLKRIGDRHRLYIVTWDGFDMPQVATSHSKARYAKWLDLSDSYDISFGEFCRTAKARLAERGRE